MVDPSPGTPENPGGASGPDLEPSPFEPPADAPSVDEAPPPFGGPPAGDDDWGRTGRSARNETTRPVRADRVPPHNLSAEESLLGAMLLSKDAIADALQVVGADAPHKRPLLNSPAD